MDAHMLAHLLSKVKTVRDRLLIVMTALTGRSVEHVRTLTWQQAYLVVSGPVPMGKSVRKWLDDYKTTHRLKPTDSLFASRKKWTPTTGVGNKPIQRIQAWRIVSKALLAINLKGAFGVLRALTAQWRIVEEDITDLLTGSPPPKAQSEMAQVRVVTRN